MANKLTFKNLKHTEMVVLVQVHNMLVARMTVEDEHDNILFEHLLMFRDRFGLQFAKGVQERKQKYSVKLDDVEATAFLQIWARNIFLIEGYEGNLINRLLNEADQYVQSLRAIRQANKQQQAIDEAQGTNLLS